MIAECRQVDPGFADHGKHVSLIRKGHSSVVYRHITHASLLLPFHMYCTKRARALAGAALDTSVSVDHKRFFDLTADRVSRTVPCALGTSFAPLRADDIPFHGCTCMGFTPLDVYKRQ